MTTERKEHIQVVRDQDFARRQRVVEYKPSVQDVVLSRVTQFLWLVVAVIVTLIGFRFVLLLIGANPANDFVAAVYNVTDALVWPFTGIVNTPDITNGGVVDMASIFAIFVYFIGIWLFIVLLNIFFSTTKSYRRSSSIEVEN